jgi:hypothetical protein
MAFLPPFLTREFLLSNVNLATPAAKATATPLIRDSSKYIGHRRRVSNPHAYHLGRMPSSFRTTRVYPPTPENEPK